MLPSSKRACVALLAAFSSSTLSCSDGNVASKLAAPPKFEPVGESKCGVVKSQAQPLIVEWPDAERGKLESVAKRHLVAVHYAGCEMQVLGQCKVPGAYGYTSLTRKKSHIRMRDSDELYANIPVFAVKFEGTLAKAGELNVAMTIVGRYEADRYSVKPEELQGDCAGATHVITALTVGAFEFFAGADAAVGAGVTAGAAGTVGAGAGAKSKSQRETLNEDGDKALCEKSTSDDRKAPEGCGALLRVEVVPLGEAKRAEPTCPSGTMWDGAQCMGARTCPPGTQLKGTSCVANVSTACAAGMHFVAGTGCVADVVAGNAAVAPGPPPPPRPPPAAMATSVDTIKAAGLVWQKQPADRKMNWEDAKAYCAGLSGGGFRLPSRQELKALFDSNSVPKEALHYWSITRLTETLPSVWTVDFSDGNIYNYHTSMLQLVRCVR